MDHAVLAVVSISHANLCSLCLDPVHFDVTRILESANPTFEAVFCPTPAVFNDAPPLSLTCYSPRVLDVLVIIVG